MQTDPSNEINMQEKHNLYAEQEKLSDDKEKTISISAPKLDALEKLYVRAYLHSLSHLEAHKVVAPSLKKHHHDNPYSRRDNIQFHISRSLQEKTEAISITPEKIIEKLYHEASMEYGSTNQSARIQALQLIGRHIGMFKEEKEKEKIIFNIVSFTDENKPKEVSVESSSLSYEEKENILPTNIQITNYSEQ